MLRSQLKDIQDKGLAPPKEGTGEDGEDGSRTQRSTSRSPSKARSLSDGGQPTLSPSPKFREPEKRKSRDDSSINESPSTPRRPTFPRGLSLQMPPRDFMTPNTSAYINRVPLSPKLDHSQTYGSPSSVLPRRSRGLDFSRAATNLHHSTLAEQSSPDSSPTIGGRAMNIPNKRNSLHFSGRDDPIAASNSLWSTMAGTERVNISSSLGSVNMMLGSDSSGSSSDEEDMMDADDIDDSILTTPQVKSDPFGGNTQASPGTGWMGQSPAVSSLMNFQRARLRPGRAIRNKSGGGKRFSMASPNSKSPPAGMRSMDGINGYFGRADLPTEGVHSRRESISWAANQLHISGNESDDGSLKSTLESVDPITPGRDGQRGVIRKVVTRRGNMLPKTKGFARIRAALAEESAPVETEVRREAEVVRLTRENDMDLEPRHQSISTQNTSPTIEPVQESLDGLPEDDMMTDISQGLSSSFKEHAKLNSKGKGFWETFKDENSRTPPPPAFLPRGSSSGISEDISLDSPSISTPPLFPSQSTSEQRSSSPSRSATPQPTQAEITRKVNNKRRRDDDFDPTSFKRRAVSPGMSVHNSPVLQTSPWGNSRPPSNGESGKPPPNGGVKQRIGFPSFVSTTNDELMKMSIE